MLWWFIFAIQKEKQAQKEPQTLYKQKGNIKSIQDNKHSFEYIIDDSKLLLTGGDTESDDDEKTEKLFESINRGIKNY